MRLLKASQPGSRSNDSDLRAGFGLSSAPPIPAPPATVTTATRQRRLRVFHVILTVVRSMFVIVVGPCWFSRLRCSALAYRLARRTGCVSCRVGQPQPAPHPAAYAA